MQTLIGVIIGIVATVVVGRYYYRRSLRRSLGVYTLLDSRVFSGIHPDVRRELDFRYQNREVDELQQLMFLVANDGERAISRPIEPLTLRMQRVEVLDASIIHRQPETLKTEIVQERNAAGDVTLRFQFPLLNSGDFFVVKMLLSGYVPRSRQVFELVAEDLPPAITIKPIPIEVLSDSKRRVEWGAAAAGAAILAVASWIWYALYLIYLPRPTWFPYPWASFVPSIGALIVGLPGGLLAIALTLTGFMVLVSAPFGGSFPPQRTPRFPLPASVRRSVGRYWTHDIYIGYPDDSTSQEPPTGEAV